MKNSFKLLKTFMKSNRSMLATGIIFLVLGIVIIVISALLADPFGAEDYLTSITITTMGYSLIYMYGFFSFMSFGTRFFYSCPAAEKIITKDVPLLTLISGIFVTIIALASHFIGLTLCGTNPQRLSDLLLCCAFAVFFGQLSAGFAGLRGTIIFSYIAGLPFYTTMFTAHSDIQLHGFGVPVYISALIFVAALIIGTLLSFAFAKNSYKKRTSSVMNIRVG